MLRAGNIYYLWQERNIWDFKQRRTVESIVKTLVYEVHHKGQIHLRNVEISQSLDYYL